MSDEPVNSNAPEGQVSQEPQTPPAPQYDAPAPTYAAPVQPQMPEAQQAFISSPQPPVEKKRSGTPIFFSALTGVIVGAAITAGALGLSGNLGDNQATPQIEQPAISAPSDSLSGSGDSDATNISVSGGDAQLAEVVAAKSLDSVVLVNCEVVENGARGESTGSGVVYSQDGYIITNYHVVDGATDIKVTLYDKTEIDAELVGSDPSSDIAVLKVDSPEVLTPMDIGDSSQLKVGQWAMALGAPYGQESSASLGIVSGLSRSTSMTSDDYLVVYTNLVQTDAAVNPGNSGGALVDSQGRLIGIPTLLTSGGTNANAGVNMAIPVNYAVKIADQLIETGYAVHPFLGTTLGTVTPQNYASGDLSVENGAYVMSVSSGSAADVAGIKEGDVIVKFGDKDVASATELIVDIRSMEIGDAVDLTVSRGNETLDLNVVLGSDSQQQQDANINE